MILHIFKIIWNKRRTNFTIMLEIGLAFLVLYAALSFTIHNLDRLNAPTGFDTENRKVAYLDKNGLTDSIAGINIELLKRDLEQIDVVESVAVSNGVSPYGGSTWSTNTDDNGLEIEFRYAYVGEDFANTMNVPLKKGRWFQEGDDTENYPPVIFGQAFIDQYYPGVDMVDSLLQFNGEEHRIIGISENYRYGGEFEEVEPTAFLYGPTTHRHTECVYLKMDPDAQISDEEKISTLVDQYMGNNGSVIMDLDMLRNRSSQRIWIPMIAILSICGFLCINVALGLFGVLWYTINMRRSEIGLRKALGSSDAQIIFQFVMEVLLLTVVAIGIVSIFAIQIPLLKVMDINSSVFYRALFYSLLIISTVVLICALYPSYQASKVDPAVSLHAD